MTKLSVIEYKHYFYMFQCIVQILFHFLISWGKVINIKISTTKLPLRYVPPIFFSAIYVALIEYHLFSSDGTNISISSPTRRPKRCLGRGNFFWEGQVTGPLWDQKHL